MYLIEDLWGCVCSFGQCYNRIRMWLKPFVMTGRGKAIAPLTLIATSILSLTLILSFFLSLSPSSHPPIPLLQAFIITGWGIAEPLSPLNHFFQTRLSLFSFSLFQLLVCFLSLHSFLHQSSQWFFRHINGTLWRCTIFICFFCPSPPNSHQVRLNCFIAGAAANSVKAFMTITDIYQQFSVHIVTSLLSLIISLCLTQFSDYFPKGRTFTNSHRQQWNELKCKCRLLLISLLLFRCFSREDQIIQTQIKN